MEHKNDMEIDLKKIALMMKKRILPISLCTLFGAVLAAAVTVFFITPQYAAEVKMYVFASTDRTDTGTITAGEIAASESLIGTYIVVLESDTVLDEVAAQLQTPIQPEEIRRRLQISAIDDSAAFRVRVTTDDAALSAAIANTIADVAPQRIMDVVGAGGVEIIDRAKVPQSPVSPNRLQNTLLGALAGLVLSFAFFFLKELFDTTIRSEEDLTGEFGLPMLGIIPALMPHTTARQSRKQTGGI